MGLGHGSIGADDHPVTEGFNQNLPLQRPIKRPVLLMR